MLPGHGLEQTIEKTAVRETQNIQKKNMRWITSLEIFLIVSLMMTVTCSAESKGVLCKGEGPGAIPDPIPDAKQQATFQCALACLKSGSASCASAGFAMKWDGPTCEAKGAGGTSRTDYTCTSL